MSTLGIGNVPGRVDESERDGCCTVVGRVKSFTSRTEEVELLSACIPPILAD